MTTRRRLLLVEDEASIRCGLEDVLAYHGYDVMAFESAEEALEHGLAAPFDLALLDVMLPGLDGFELCRRLRTVRPEPPILMLTAKGAEDDVVRGLESGADDYVTKPFSLRELLARVEALLRRTRSSDDGTPLRFGPWRIQPGELRATRDGNHEIRELTPREVEIVAFFVRERGRIVSRRALLQKVWGMAHVDEVETRTVDMHIAKLRKKLDPEFRWLSTIRGAGYRFEG